MPLGLMPLNAHKTDLCHCRLPRKDVILPAKKSVSTPHPSLRSLRDIIKGMQHTRRAPATWRMGDVRVNRSANAQDYWMISV